MRRLAKIYEGEVKKIEYKDINVGDNIFRKITVPRNKGVVSALKIRRLMRGFDDFDKCVCESPLKLILDNFEGVVNSLQATDIIFFADTTDYLHLLLPVILKNREAMVCVPPEIYSEANDFFMDKAGAACVFLQKSLPCTVGRTVVAMPDAKGEEIPYARLVLDLCGRCEGENIKRVESIRIRPPLELMSTGETRPEVIAVLAEYFGVECRNLQVF